MGCLGSRGLGVKVWGSKVQGFLGFGFEGCGGSSESGVKLF